MNSSERYDAFLDITRQIHALELAAEFLSWDQQTGMPPKGAPARALQLSTVEGIRHAVLTGDELGEHLEALGNGVSLDGDAAVNVREMERLRRRALCIPNALVREISKVQSLAMEAWIRARSDSDFGAFAPWLGEMLDLKRQEADEVGYDECRYDALHDEYEPGSTARRLKVLFRTLRDELVPLVAELADSPAAAKRKGVVGDFAVDRQKAFAVNLLTTIGFDWDAGRVDVSAHPFCSGNLHDVRLTTRYDENDITRALFGLLHEGGHGLYEQGFDPAFEGTPRARAVSLGIHESQSRMWENLVGRSRPFWEFALPLLHEAFPFTSSVGLDDWYAAINRVERSMIRVEADEVTYNLHIILRFELEMELIEDRLSVADLPAAWNDRMKSFLGVVPANDAEGVLQDIHWAHGIFGYFPTYALGNLYASQFFHAARNDIPGMDEAIRKGNFAPLLGWLREKIHTRGRTLWPEDLVKDVTGEALNADYQLDYLKEKFRSLYGAG